MATDFKGYLLAEFLEDYQEGELSRREAVKLISGVVGSVAVANSLLAACAPPEAVPMSLATIAPTVSGAQSSTEEPLTTEVSATEPPSSEEDIAFPGSDAELMAYLARPADEGHHSAVLVCHENRGLTEHIKDVTRRVASAGYVGLAVDLLTRNGGTAALDSSDVPGILGNTPASQLVDDFIAGWDWLKANENVNPEAVGMVGFCFGGGVTWRVAIGLPDVRAAVPYYGPHPDPDDLEAIQAAVLAVYAGNDQRINQSIPEVEAAMQQLGKTYENVIYPATDHAFHNDTGSRYDEEAATDAWARTLDWFGRYLD